MKILPLASIQLEDRQRKRIEPGPLRELEQSILDKGLIHAPLVRREEDGSHWLVAGGRRLAAIGNLTKAGKEITYDGYPIPLGDVPVTYLHELADAEEVELDENIIRVDLTWQERNMAYAAIHKKRVAQDVVHTKRDTANEIIQKTGEQVSPRQMEQRIQQALLINEHMDKPSVAKARDATEAYNAALKLQEEAARSVLARRQAAKMEGKQEIEIRHADMLTLLPQLEAETFDLVIADPPYGIDASGGGFRARTVHHHNYSDDVATARSVATCILSEGFRLCKKRANLFMFTDIKHWQWLQDTSANLGWTPWRTPILWHKSDSEGLAPWGRQGFRRTYEVLFYATKGQKGLLSSPVDILRVNRVPRNERIHAAEKPIELMRTLIECSTLAGDYILDPCCGSGSSLVAARELKRRGLGIEKDDTYVQTAIANLHARAQATPSGSNNPARSDEAGESESRGSGEDTGAGEVYG